MKAYAIEVFFDSSFDQYVRDLWKKCDNEQISSFMEKYNGVEPHIALTRYENVDSERLIHVFDEFIESNINSFELFIDSVSVFPISNVTYLQPNVSNDFNALMSKVHSFFKEFETQCSPYYSEKRWFPHISIAKNKTTEELKRAMNFVVDHFVSQKLVVKRLGLVEIDYVSCKTLKYKELI
jgi:hypothetical protein